MQDIQINQSATNTILSFYDNRLDYFYATSEKVGYSFHVGHIKSIEILTDKGGRHSLVVKTAYHTNKDDVGEQALPKVRELVAAVQEAMLTIKL